MVTQLLYHGAEVWLRAGEHAGPQAAFVGLPCDCKALTSYSTREVCHDVFYFQQVI